ncbi:MAG TPA: VIT domain-containing protein [Candidatus Polarisedimenticolia bacterium]|nr:VIT domain-containing protein [Candidatus Polarisedimenticolia bacterium]
MPHDLRPDPRRPATSDSLSPFLLAGTRVRTWITGPVAHVEVTQTWENSNDQPVDGLYIFPLPENAAVNDMTLTIGERTIQGEMRRRDEARQAYEQARREGRTAALLDQERPNVFAQRVANLAPRQRIEVKIAFDYEIRCAEGACEYSFPTVVGPRFIPARQTDPGEIAPPIVSEGSHARQRFSMTVSLEAGVEAHELQSPSHRISITPFGKGGQRVTLAAEEKEIPNRDFKLRWKVGSGEPEVGVLAWRDPGGSDPSGVFTLILQPPADFDTASAAPRELVFVLDCSGSMSGVPLEAAKGVVRRSLGAVRPEDTFQILRFSDATSGMGSRPLAPTRDNLRKALAYLDSLQGEGGTEMILGIRAALDFPKDPRRLRIVAFLTDGYIGNESEILKEVRSRLGEARLFAFGIGSSVNRYLLEGLAEEGRGEAAFLGPRETPDEMVQRFTRRIDAPVLTDVHISWRDLEVTDTIPERAPDLFDGQPLILQGRYRRAGTGVVEVEGFSGGSRRIYRRNVTLPEKAEGHEALGRLWARARIHQLERDLHDGPSPSVVESITRLGLGHHLMTPYTSLVAVDSEISNWTGSSAQVGVPVEMPEDVSYQGIIGRGDAPVAARQTMAVSPGVSGGLLSGFGLAKDSPAAGSLPPARNAAPMEEKAKPASQEGDRAPGNKKEARDEESTKAPGFTRLTIYEDGSDGIALEGDGSLYRLRGVQTTFLKKIDASEMEEVRRALTQAGTDRWRGGGGGPRIVLDAGKVTRVIGLSSSDPSVQALAALLRSLASLPGKASSFP